MAEDLIVNGTTKQEKYESLLPQIKALVENEENLTANMANVCASLKYCFDFLWVGFYLVNKNQLVLGPFQGPIACTRIDFGKGVCGASWKNNDVIIVDDVDNFPGHIACSSLSKSEIVLPIYNFEKKMVGVLDVDSDRYNFFDETDKIFLNKILQILKF